MEEANLLNQYFSALRFSVLDENGEVLPVNSIREWAHFMESPQRDIQLDQVGDYRVSTVFLGLNHQFSADPKAPSLWFETMVFGPAEEREIFGKKHLIPTGLWQQRSTTLAQAKQAHQTGRLWLAEYLAAQEQPT